MSLIPARSATIFFGTPGPAPRAPLGLEVEPQSITMVLVDGRWDPGLLDVFRRAQHLARLEERSRIARVPPPWVRYGWEAAAAVIGDMRRRLNQMGGL